MSAQNIISFGLDVSSFNDQKRAKLNEFIELFDKLSKYDGKKISPVLGSGYAEFNASIKETNGLLSELVLRLKAIENTHSGISTKQKAASNSFKDATNTMNSNTAAVKRNTDATKENAEKVASLGSSLTKAYTVLTRIAYIIPGLGIAGVFNIAFEALGNLLREMGVMSNELEKTLDRNIEINKTLQQQFDIYKSITDQRREFYQIVAENSSFSLKGDIDLLKASGENKYVIFDKKIEEATALYKEQLKTLGPEGILGAHKKIEEALISQEETASRLDELNRIKNIKDSRSWWKKIQTLKSDVNNQGVVDPSDGSGLSLFGASFNTKKDDKGNFYYYNKDISDKQIEEETGRLQVQKQISSELLKNSKAFIDAENLLNSEKLAKLKAFNDELRKLNLEQVKYSEENIIFKQGLIQKDDRSTLDEIISSINKIKDAEIAISAANKKYVSSNNSSTDIEKQIAALKERYSNIKTTSKAEYEIEKEKTEFYQRFIKARSEISKSEIEQDAINNEKLFKNEEKSLEDRIDAYKNYIIGKQILQDIEYERDIQKGASGPGGKTSLTKEEGFALLANKNTLQSNIQADAEKQIYEIVSTSLQKQIKLILDYNDIQNTESIKSYSIGLQQLNKSFGDKKIRYEEYRKQRIELDRKYNIIESEEKLKDDEQDLKRLQDHLEKLKQEKEQSDDEVSFARNNKANAADSGQNQLEADREYNSAVGKNNAIRDAILRAEKEIKIARDNRDKDELDAAKAKYDKLLEYQKEYAENNRKILEELYKFTLAYINKEYEEKLQKVVDNRSIVDEQYGYEIDAIEKSSLTAKRKAALDIQLNAEKQAYDKQAEAEERKLKHDKAIDDRNMALAHIAWNTADAVVSALAIPPPAGEILAFQRGVIGAIQAATVLATPIPYAEGTPEGGHPGGLARYGEAGWEVVKEPYKSPYLVTKETVSFLPKGTDVIPVEEADFTPNSKKDESWLQMRWLAKQLKKQNGTPKISNNIYINLGHENYKKKILGN